ncbi:uncharacterized protein SPSK_04662 [Sporothrix schenckii 1099-18]|uniref:Uncharacterized protein n=1 Tax=Sporothrix schenckii 1099-18 TaxID=1397361 RepID=A0A0F2M1Y5_SPOSC|nr:uncharacterized protein SPSK_04662 [Sporothrix schenckii 1099-18]KJR83099.1 hypothetical protein SPSK_04662 [Sporothrix schenckii 1099-18]
MRGVADKNLGCHKTSQDEEKSGSGRDRRGRATAREDKGQETAGQELDSGPVDHTPNFNIDKGLLVGGCVHEAVDRGMGKATPTLPKVDFDGANRDATGDPMHPKMPPTLLAASVWCVAVPLSKTWNAVE